MLGNVEQYLAMSHAGENKFRARHVQNILGMSYSQRVGQAQLVSVLNPFSLCQRSNVGIFGNQESIVSVAVPPWPQSITWYNSEGKIDDETPGSRYKQIADGLGGYALEIKPTEACDQGEWKCVAKSDQGVIAITTCDIKMISKHTTNTPI